MIDDEQLILAIRGGERARFGALVERYQRPVYRFLRNMRLEHDEAADIMQNVFINAYRKLDSLREPGKFRSWLFMIASNQARNYFRESSRRREVPLEDAEPVFADENPDLTLEKQGLKKRLEAALEHLPVKQRQVVVLRAFEELPFDEVARACGIRLSTAKVSYHRALKKMAGWLGPLADN